MALPVAVTTLPFLMSIFASPLPFADICEPTLMPSGPLPLGLRPLEAVTVTVLLSIVSTLSPTLDNTSMACLEEPDADAVVAPVKFTVLSVMDRFASPALVPYP